VRRGEREGEQRQIAEERTLPLFCAHDGNQPQAMDSMERVGWIRTFGILYRDFFFKNQ
jgi:hypothetical protein